MLIFLYLVLNFLVLFLFFDNKDIKFLIKLLVLIYKICFLILLFNI